METMILGRLQPSRGSGRHERRQLQQGKRFCHLLQLPWIFSLMILSVSLISTILTTATSHRFLGLHVIHVSQHIVHCLTSGSLCSPCVNSLRFLRIKMRAILPGFRRPVIMFGRLHTCISYERSLIKSVVTWCNWL